LDNILTGINATFFAFGITGSGKTHTIFGSDNDFGICIRYKLIIIYLEQWIIYCKKLRKKIFKPVILSVSWKYIMNMLEIFLEKIIIKI